MSEYDTYRMPFGKHKGEMLCDIPVDYLIWVLNECDIRDYLYHAITAVVDERRRSRHGSSRSWSWESEPPRSSSKSSSLSVDVDRWYRQLSIEFHPDRRGGSNEAMKAINRGKELLEEIIRRS